MTGAGDSRHATATVVFTDVVGSTELRSGLGDDQADELRREHDQLLRDALTGRGGTVVRGTGDGLMAVFGSAAEAIGAGGRCSRRPAGSGSSGGCRSRSGSGRAPATSPGKGAYEEARVAAGRGDVARARAARDECLAHAVPLGMTALVRRAGALALDG